VYWWIQNTESEVFFFEGWKWSCLQANSDSIIITHYSGMQWVKKCNSETKMLNYQLKKYSVQKNIKMIENVSHPSGLFSHWLQMHFQIIEGLRPIKLWCIHAYFKEMLACAFMQVVDL